MVNSIYLEILRLNSMLDTIRRDPLLKDKIVCVRTRNSKVAAELIKNGADMISDDSGASVDSKMAEFLGREDVPFILRYQHSHSSNDSLQNLIAKDKQRRSYFEEFSKRINYLVKYGVNK